MTIFNLLDQISDSAPTTAPSSRREMFRTLGKATQKVAAAAVPFGLAAVTSNKALASGEDVADVLNFALLLEYLEAEYYVMGLDSGVIPAGSDAEKAYQQIAKHETAHVELLKSAIGSLGGTPIDKPGFDFTAGGLFNPFEDYAVYLILSQAFEDTGVRAYKGQAANLINNDAILTVALQIHSVEARHASQVRRFRGLKGWITANQRGEGVPAVAQPVYDGEQQVVQAGINVQELTGRGQHRVSESYDEPLTKEEVTAIATLFLA